VVHTDQECSDHGRNFSGHLREIFNTSVTTKLFENCILLTGHVGAGKTTFARGLIRELSSCGDDEDIPSPTFCLDFNYPLANDGAVFSRFPRGVHHLDLYRLQGEEPGDLDALEFSDLTRNAITIVEWPDRLASRNIVLDGALWVDLQLGHQEISKSFVTDEPMTEEMFERWISVPRHLTFKCSSSSLWSDRIESM
jgi:tRNA threonylcarbamoyl adenosine modification protein YjeE